MFPRECWHSKPFDISQTLTTRYQQTTREYATTWTTPRCGEMLVVTHHGSDNSQRSPSLANTNNQYPTGLRNLQSSRSATQTLDIHCWWMKHLRLPIRDRERGWIDYLTINSNPNLVFHFYLLVKVLSAEQWRATSLWLQTSFVIWRLKWGSEMKGVRYSTVPYCTGTVPGIPFLEIFRTRKLCLAWPETAFFWTR